MKAFLDTSVLVASFYGDHEHHKASLELFLRHGKGGACCGAHSLAEVYSTLTGMPGARRVDGDTALLFLANIRELLTLVALDEQEYARTIEHAARMQLSGGAIYDALLGFCMLKADAETLYTWNTRDFLRLPPEIAGRVATPE